MVPPIKVTPQGQWATATTASTGDQDLSVAQEEVCTRWRDSRVGDKSNTDHDLGWHQHRGRRGHWLASTSGHERRYHQ